MMSLTFSFKAWMSSPGKSDNSRRLNSSRWTSSCSKCSPLTIIFMVAVNVTGPRAETRTTCMTLLRSSGRRGERMRHHSIQGFPAGRHHLWWRHILCSPEASVLLEYIPLLDHGTNYRTGESNNQTTTSARRNYKVYKHSNILGCYEDPD